MAATKKDLLDQLNRVEVDRDYYLELLEESQIFNDQAQKVIMLLERANKLKSDQIELITDLTSTIIELYE